MSGTGCHSSDTRVISILDAISQPTAPYYEHRVAAAIRRLILPMVSNPKVRFTQDRYGNLLLTWWNAQGKALPCLALASHMDHPAFDPLEETAPGRIRADILGWLPRGDELVGTRIEVHGEERTWGGRVSAFANDEHSQVFFEMDVPFDGDMAAAFAVPDLVRFDLRPPLVHGRAMDDLVGCAMQLAVFEQVVTLDLPIDFMAIFHRAEEVGFMGAYGACLLGSIPRHAIVVSLEASKALDGAAVGEGIVVRTGDRMYQFDPNAQSMLDAAAGVVGQQGLNVQHRRMDGGVCEASLYLAFGYQATGLAVPLINYHNHGDGRVEAEAVAVYDLNVGAELLVAAARILADSRHLPWSDFRTGVDKRFRESAHRLIEICI